MHDHLNQLFARLAQAFSTASAAGPKSCDELAILSLKILALLFSQKGPPAGIAKQLSLAFEIQEFDAGHDLLRSFDLIDQGLQENLRGFSSLLSTVLEENALRRDPAVLLANLPDTDGKVTESFHEMLSLVESYSDLEQLFELKGQKVLAILFLHSFGRLLERGFEPDRVDGPALISAWLMNRVKNKALYDLYVASLSPFSVFSFSSLGRYRFKELLLIALCHKAARGEAIKDAEALGLDQALHAVGMLGLKPLLDSGFLVLEEKSPCWEQQSSKMLTL